MEAGVLSVDLQGASVHRLGGRLQVRDAEGVVRAEVPAFKLHAVWLFGGVEVTNAVLRLALSEGPVLHFLTRQGRHRGCVGPEPGHRAALRVRQYRHLSRSRTRVPFAREIVRAKLKTQLERVRAWSRNRKIGMADVIEFLLAALDLLDAETTVDGLLGLEGTATRKYFEGYGRLFTFDFGFRGRNRRPPRDPVNALLSLGYTLLYTEVLSAVLLAGLDPYIGGLHAVKDGRCSLALDLMEPFRWIVDELVLARMNLATFTTKDFRQDVDGAVFLQPAALPRFVAVFGERLAAPLALRSAGSPTVRQALRTVARGVRGVMLHPERPLAEVLQPSAGAQP
ncbi:MAG: CRISPR-associated protein Cas1 [Candidatus Ozemobacter sibiricus]|jgi:CRISPR-associated protein Cas1|uniref:CRISPR-associated endonuclease Cas1 n=1 Tax=Candidatus Ozemobacter sibiricus TaxID=2268124 RepID=A0A367ZKF1_9BACT|nr:MAG: CRISPR-associated protein Cas1 [Candidatus Ozemobacter sibiricus]